MWYKVGEWGTQCMVRVRWGCWVRVLCFLCGVYVLCVPAGWSDPHSHSAVCKWSKDIAVSVGCGLCVAESCLLWGPWLTLGWVSGIGKVPLRAQPTGFFGLLILRQRFTWHLHRTSQLISVSTKINHQGKLRFAAEDKAKHISKFWSQLLHPWRQALFWSFGGGGRLALAASLLLESAFPGVWVPSTVSFLSAPQMLASWPSGAGLFPASKTLSARHLLSLLALLWGGSDGKCPCREALMAHRSWCCPLSPLACLLWDLREALLSSILGSVLLTWIFSCSIHFLENSHKALKMC